MAQEPAERRIAYGQGIQPQTATMPDGSVITYWRKVRCWRQLQPGGRGRNRTGTGDEVRQGVVAVDSVHRPAALASLRPRLRDRRMALHRRRIRSRRIDLYDDANFQSAGWRWPQQVQCPTHRRTDWKLASS